jgi:hypothetical protein
MRHFTFNFVLFLACFLRVGAATAQTHCAYAGELFSVGSTICECPSLKGDGGLATGGHAQISSRRLACEEHGNWVKDNSFCVETTYDGSAGLASDDFAKYNTIALDYL